MRTNSPANSCVSSGLAICKDTEVLVNWVVHPCTQTNHRNISFLIFLEKFMPSALEKDAAQYMNQS